jgi:hypothetical protein
MLSAGSGFEISLGRTFRHAVNENSRKAAPLGASFQLFFGGLGVPFPLNGSTDSSHRHAA